MKKDKLLIPYLVFTIIYTGCETKNNSKPVFIHQDPEYHQISLKPDPDTLDIPPAGRATTVISSYNYFTSQTSSYLSVYDSKVDQITIYSFPEGRVIKAIPLKKWLIGYKLDNVSIFTYNFDSIFVCTKYDLILIDTNSRIKKTVEIKEGQKIGFAHETPGAIHNNVLYLNNFKAIDEKSLAAHKNYKVLTGLNLQNDEQLKFYSLPQIYREHIYGYSFLKYSYCINDRNNFVFSFPADTNIYESDLAEFHRSYYAKSRNQSGDITPITQKDIKDGQSYFEYSIRDSYGPIFYDPSRKHYLRIAKQKVPDSTVFAKNRIRKRSIVFLNENFKVIGEAPVPDSLNIYSLFITKEGNMYVKASNTKKPFISFIKLNYEEIGDILNASTK